MLINQPGAHTNPHDHKIEWDNERGNPVFVKLHINYPDGNAPEFKLYEVKSMSNPIIIPPDFNINFETISDFKDCVNRNGEVEFIQNGKTYDISMIKRTPDSPSQIVIYEAYKEETEMWCNTADEVLEYIIDGVRLREIITEVKVTARTF